jgi:hypothetical protein
MVRIVRASILALVAGLSVAAAQAKDNQPEMGTPQQRQACGTDVGRFCRKIKPEDGPMAYLGCLQEHRRKLSNACRSMLAGVGQ